MADGVVIAGIGIAAGLLMFGRKKPRRTSSAAGLDGSTVWDGVTPTPTWLPKGPRRTGPGPQRTADVLEEICRQWKIGTNRAAWSDAHHAAANSAVHRAIVALARPWETIPEAKQYAFEVTREAIFDLCPKVPLPGTRELVDQLRGQHFWLDELWGRIYALAWNRITGQTAGP